jgi:hypothetical protein
MKMFSKKYKVEDDKVEDDWGWGFYIDIDTDIDSDIENAIPKINYENEYENKYNDYNLYRFLQICNFSVCTFIVLYGFIQLV